MRDANRHRQRALDIVGSRVFGENLDQRGLPGEWRCDRNTARDVAGGERQVAIGESAAPIGAHPPGPLPMLGCACTSKDRSPARNLHHIGAAFRKRRNVIEHRWGQIDPGSGKSPALSVFAVSTATHSPGVIEQSIPLVPSGGSNIARVAPTIGNFILQPSVT